MKTVIMELSGLWYHIQVSLLIVHDNNYNMVNHNKKSLSAWRVQVECRSNSKRVKLSHNSPSWVSCGLLIMVFWRKYTGFFLFDFLFRQLIFMIDYSVLYYNHYLTHKRVGFKLAKTSHPERDFGTTWLVGTLSSFPSHSNSLDEWMPADEICWHPIFNWVAMTRPKW